jgi:hypothetical protein
MIDEERDQRLVAAAMYYFGQLDAGMQLGLADLVGALPADLRNDVIALVSAIHSDRLENQPASTPWSRPAEVVRQALQDLRGRK